MPAEDDFETVLEKIRQARNFDFRNYKRATLMRRIARRMGERRATNVADYLKLLEREPEEFDALISGILIKVTSFFRDTETWEALSKRVIPELLQRRRPNEEIRVWCAGCATGEEAYSIAMLLAEALGSRYAETQVKVFGTDADEHSVAVARRGIYGAQQIATIPKKLLHKYFTRVAEGYTVRKEIRRAAV